MVIGALSAGRDGETAVAGAFGGAAGGLDCRADKTALTSTRLPSRTTAVSNRRARARGINTGSD